MKKIILSLFGIGVLVFVCRAGYQWIFEASSIGSPEMAASPENSRTNEQGKTPPQRPLETAQAYRRFARQVLDQQRSNFEACLLASASDLEVDPSDPIVLDLNFRASPTGSGRAWVRPVRPHSIPEVLDTWLRVGRKAGKPEPEWQPRPDLIPPNCLARILVTLDLPKPPEESVSLSWALPSLQSLGAVPAAAPSP